MNGTIDATVVLAGAPTAALIDLAAQRDMRLIPLEADKVQGLLEDYPFYQIHEIPAGTYDGQDAPVTVINDPATIFTSKSADEEAIYSITKTIFDNLDRLGEVHRSEEHTSELQSLMRISYAVFCLKKKI